MDRQRSIGLMNRGVADELQAVHQYMYFHFHLDDQGFSPLAMQLRRIAIVEMTHTELLAERILFLGGDVEMVPSAAVEAITDPEAILEWAVKAEQTAVDNYNKWALESAENADAATRQVFETLISDEEGHLDEFETQLENIQRFGLSYLALQSFGDGTEGPPTTG